MDDEKPHISSAYNSALNPENPTPRTAVERALELADAVRKRRASEGGSTKPDDDAGMSMSRGQRVSDAYARAQKMRDEERENPVKREEPAPQQGETPHQRAVRLAEQLQQQARFHTPRDRGRER